jgi:hypothetical protein
MYFSYFNIFKSFGIFGVFGKHGKLPVFIGFHDFDGTGVEWQESIFSWD